MRLLLGLLSLCCVAFSSGQTLKSIDSENNPIYGGDSGTVDVRLTAPATTNTVVSLSSSNPAVSVPASVTVVTGQSLASAAFTSNVVTQETSVSVRATLSDTQFATQIVVKAIPIPTILRISQTTGSTVRIYFSTLFPGSSNQLERRTNGGNWTSVGNYSALQAYVNPGYGNHEFRVRARRGNGYSDWSPIVAFSDQDPISTFVDPLVVTVEPTVKGQRIRWTSVSDATQYELYMGPTDQGPPPLVVTTKGLEYEFEFTRADVTYSVIVKAIRSNGNMSTADAQFVGTGIPLSTPFGGLQVADGFIYGICPRGGKAGVGGGFQCPTTATNQFIQTLFALDSGIGYNFAEESLQLIDAVTVSSTTSALLYENHNDPSQGLLLIRNGSTITPIRVSTPVGLTAASSTSFYVVSREGGANGTGGLYSVTNGVLSLLTSFDDMSYDETNATGAFPCTKVTLTASAIYGYCSAGGSSGVGTLWAYKNGLLTATYSFEADSDDERIVGSYIDRPPVIDSRSVYGIAYKGGPSGGGTVFSISSGALTILKSFSLPGTTEADMDGAYPCDIVSASTKDGVTLARIAPFYVITENGGQFNTGVLWYFQPTASLICSGIEYVDGPKRLCLTKDAIYGISRDGGAASSGCVFKVVGNTMTIIAECAK